MGVDTILPGLKLMATCVASPARQSKNFEHFPPNIFQIGVWSISSPHKAWCNTVVVLPTEAPGRQRTQTRTQASPAVSESEARLAIGSLVVDNSGPESTGSEFAASVMRQLRRPNSLCSRQMSQWMATMKSRRTPPVCLHIAKERFAGWWIFVSTLQLPQSV